MSQEAWTVQHERTVQDLATSDFFWPTTLFVTNKLMNPIVQDEMVLQFLGEWLL